MRWGRYRAPVGGGRLGTAFAALRRNSPMIIRFLRATRTSPRPSFAGRWAAYPLAAVLSMLAVPSADAAIVTINLSSAGSGTPTDITGTNAGKTFNSGDTTVTNFAAGGNLAILFKNSYIGLDGTLLVSGTSLAFAVNASPAANSDPRKYAQGQSIGSDSPYWSTTNSRTAFYGSLGPAVAPNFGPGSFMGFRVGTTGSFNYGYIEVLWNWTGTPSTSTFQLLSAAYESTLNTAITTPVSTPAPASVPEPSTGVMGLAGLVWAGLAGFQRRRAR